MFAKTERIFVNILLIIWCVYLRDGKFVQLSYNFLWVSCHCMNAPVIFESTFYIYIDIYYDLLFTAIDTLFVWVGSRKCYTQYIVFSSQYFLFFVYIFLYFSNIFWKFFPIFSPIFFNISSGRPVVDSNYHLKLNFEWNWIFF